MDNGCDFELAISPTIECTLGSKRDGLAPLPRNHVVLSLLGMDVPWALVHERDL